MDPWSVGLGLFSLGFDLFNQDQNNKTARDNLDFQRDALRQNLALQKQAWAREDNAVQRRTADLYKAGLNPVLAAGSSAQSMSPVKVEALRSEKVNNVNPGNRLADAIDFSTRVGATRAGTEVALAQANMTSQTARQAKENFRFQHDQLESAAAKMKYDADASKYNAQIVREDAIRYKRTGIRPGSENSIPGQVGTAFDMIEKGANNFKEDAIKGWNEIKKGASEDWERLKKRFK